MESNSLRFDSATRQGTVNVAELFGMQLSVKTRVLIILFLITRCQDSGTSLDSHRSLKVSVKA